MKTSGPEVGQVFDLPLERRDARRGRSKTCPTTLPSLLGFFCAFCAFLRPVCLRADTVALWLFDEQVGVYPSSVLNDAGPKSYFLILGRGGEIVPGRFGNALR